MTTSLQSNGKYLVEPDKRRGELHIVYVSGVASGGSGRVKLEWKDRRTKVRCFVVYICCVNVCNIVVHICEKKLYKPALNSYLLYIQTTLTYTNNT